MTGRNELAKQSGIAESTVERILRYRENEHQIEQQKNNRFRIITIVNWQYYQQAEQQNEQQANNKRKADGQQMDTNKNDKNVKNEKKEEEKEEKSSADYSPVNSSDEDVQRRQWYSPLFFSRRGSPRDVSGTQEEEPAVFYTHYHTVFVVRERIWCCGAAVFAEI